MYVLNKQLDLIMNQVLSRIGDGVGFAFVF